MARWQNGGRHGGVSARHKHTFYRHTLAVLQVSYNNPYIVVLKCLGDIEGPRWLNGRTADGTVEVAATTEPPFTGTKWEVVPID